MEAMARSGDDAGKTVEPATDRIAQGEEVPSPRALLAVSSVRKFAEESA